jgi:hypothetical protein
MFACLSTEDPELVLDEDEIDVEAVDQASRLDVRPSTVTRDRHRRRGSVLVAEHGYHRDPGPVLSKRRCDVCGEGRDAAPLGWMCSDESYVHAARLPSIRLR